MRDQAGTVAVIGSGTMGAGIAQIAAAAGHPVLLHDARPGAAEQAIAGIASALEQRVHRGKLAQGERTALLGRLSACGTLADSVRRNS